MHDAAEKSLSYEEKTLIYEDGSKLFICASIISLASIGKTGIKRFDDRVVAEIFNGFKKLSAWVVPGKIVFEKSIIMASLLARRRDL